MEVAGMSFVLIIYLLILLLPFLIVLLVAGLSLAAYLLEAIPLYSMAKKMGRKYAWLVWIPVYYCRAYVLSDLAGDKPVELIPGKWVVQNRLHAYLIYLLIALFGGSVVAAFSIIPVIGPILAMLPGAICAYFQYIYLKDALDLFKEDKKANTTASIIVTVADFLFTCGLARAIYLLTIMKREPLTYPTETF